MNNHEARKTMEVLFNRDTQAYHYLWTKSVEIIPIDHSLTDEAAKYKEQKALNLVLDTIRDELKILTGHIVDIHRNSNEDFDFQKETYSQIIDQITGAAFNNILISLIGKRQLEIMSTQAFRTDILNNAFKLTYMN